MISKKLASIDIGSNAIRLLICTANEVENDVVFKKNALIRVPIRLGQDVFTTGKISDRNKKRFIDAMIGFKHLMKAHEVENFVANATSAMRNASNSKELLKETLDKTNIPIEVINGAKEAKIIYETHIESLLEMGSSYFYIDVGGGSTEITIFDGKNVVASKSFKIGTIRLLNNQINQEKLNDFKAWIKKHTQSMSQIKAIASGGNINRVFKIIGAKKWSPISLVQVQDIQKQISALSYEQRQIQFNMNPDRADVIIPALEIYTSAFQAGNIEEIYVPKIGLADGLVRKLYNSNKKIEFLL
jgi:exopolyphosphatase/guanosine-5'-triphosphate,3'-diphosphate pyrophosphatase